MSLKINSKEKTVIISGLHCYLCCNPNYLDEDQIQGTICFHFLNVNIISLFTFQLLSSSLSEVLRANYVAVFETLRLVSFNSAVFCTMAYYQRARLLMLLLSHSRGQIYSHPAGSASVSTGRWGRITQGCAY